MPVVFPYKSFSAHHLGILDDSISTCNILGSKGDTNPATTCGRGEEEDHHIFLAHHADKLGRD
jgi:hypothetical protein